ncbi:MAG: DUF1186 domain-containing protein [Chloroflexota bacterium]
MNVTEILSALKRPVGTFPLEAVQAAIADPEAVTQGLLNELEHAIQNADALLKDEEYMGHLFAMHLLAQFREERAYPLIVDFISLDPETVDLLMGDTVTEGLAPILASVCGGDIEPLKQVIEDKNIYEWVRSTTIKTIAILVAKDVITRDVALDYFKSLYSKFPRDHSEEVLWSYLVFYSNELYPDTLYAEIEQAFKDDLIDP